MGSGRRSSLEDSVKINSFMDFQIVPLKIIGLWPYEERFVFGRDVTALLRGLSTLQAGIILLLPLVLTYLNLRACFEAWGRSLDDLADVIVNTIIYSFLFFLAFYFFLFQPQIRELIEYCEANFRKRSMIGLTYVTAIESYKKSKKFARIWLILCMFSALLWALHPVFVGRKILPLNNWYPFDEDQPYAYEIMYLLQFLGQVQVGLLFSSCTSFFVSCVILICGQYDILFCSFKNVYHTAKMLNGWDMEDVRRVLRSIILSRQEVGQYLYGEELIEEIDVIKCALDEEFDMLPCKRKDFRQCLLCVLKRCVQHHQDILRFCKMVEKFFSWYCFAKSLQISYQMCFLTFVAVNSEGSLLRRMNLIQYLIVTILELIFFTYYGEILSRHSQRVGESLLRAPWCKFGTLVRKDILIILANSMVPVRLSGKFFIVNTKKIRSIVTAALSYFTLLQSIKARKQDEM